MSIEGEKKNEITDIMGGKFFRFVISVSGDVKQQALCLFVMQLSLMMQGKDWALWILKMVILLPPNSITIE
jgi:hypothetical protein